MCSFVKVVIFTLDNVKTRNLTRKIILKNKIPKRVIGKIRKIEFHNEELHYFYSLPDIIRSI